LRRRFGGVGRRRGFLSDFKRSRALGSDWIGEAKFEEAVAEEEDANDAVSNGNSRIFGVVSR
jgi:hypothetical protein